MPCGYWIVSPSMHSSVLRVLESTMMVEFIELRDWVFVPTFFFFLHKLVMCILPYVRVFFVYYYFFVTVNSEQATYF